MLQRLSLWIIMCSGILFTSAAWSAGKWSGHHSVVRKDTLITPKRVALYSMLFPGLGQISNKQYWKLPVVYGCLGAGIYSFQYNLSGYNEFRKIYADRLQNIYTDKYIHSIPDIGGIKDWRDYHKRYLDLTVLLSVVGYGLQIIDAHVAAHLSRFDLTPDLSLRLQPSLQPGPYGIVTGASIVFKPRYHLPRKG